MIVRWGLAALAGGTVTKRVSRSRCSSRALAGTHCPSPRARAGAKSRRSGSTTQRRDADGGVIALGGGSAIDLGKAISAAAGVPLVSVPTTYAGAEWTTYYGVRDPERKMRGGGAGAHPAGIVYEPELTLDLPRETTVGTAMNALAHCAEALYVVGHNDDADEHALAGARLIAAWLPRVVETPRDLEARTELLRGACHGGAALGGSGLALAHAMAQAIGGRYGLPHGTLNGICLPPVLRWNAQWVPDAVQRFTEAAAATSSSWPRSAARRGSRSSACRGRICGSSRRPPRAAPATRRTRGRRCRSRSRSCCVRSGDYGKSRVIPPPPPTYGRTTLSTVSTASTTITAESTGRLLTKPCTS